MNLPRLLALFLAVGGVVFATSNERWMTDLEAAKARAAREHKPLLIEFTGSAWCGPCIALHKNVFSTAEFAAFSRDIVWVALDYPTLAERVPEKVKANPALARLMAIKEKYEVPGFPTLIYYDAEGKERAKITGYGGESPREFLAKLRGSAK